MVTLEQLSSDIRTRHEETNSWRKAAAPYGINAATARLIASGYIPGAKIRSRLGLAPTATVVVVTGGAVPHGAQVVSASLCSCGQYYISNHPARKKCFMCSPYRKTIKRKEGNERKPEVSQY